MEQKTVTQAQAQEVSQQFAEFLDIYLEEQRICFYIPHNDENAPPEPVTILAKKSLSDIEGFYPHFLSLFNINADDFGELVTKFKELLSTKFNESNLTLVNEMADIDYNDWYLANGFIIKNKEKAKVINMRKIFDVHLGFKQGQSYLIFRKNN